MKKILTLDGGGIHGLFSIAVVEQIEEVLRRRLKAGPEFRLCDYFDMIAGTSTGAIIAAFLSWGLSAREVRELYIEHAGTIFCKNTWYLRVWSRFASDPISDFLRTFFAEADGSPALLGTGRLRTLLLVVMKNGTTGSPWPLTNFPGSKYNDRRTRGAGSNLNIPLWQLVRASTAAPTFFPPQRIRIEDREYEFIDGGITPFNNPSHLAFLMATLPEYRIGFETGEDRLLLVSVGTGRRDSHYGEGEIQDMHLLSHVKAIIRTLMDGGAVYQDVLCRARGVCRFGDPIDSELGDLRACSEGAAAKAFSYVRYNYTYSETEVAAALAGGRCDWQLDSLPLIPFICGRGSEYAREAVQPGHFEGFNEPRTNAGAAFL